MQAPAEVIEVNEDPNIFLLFVLGAPGMRMPYVAASKKKKSHIRRPDRNCPSRDPNPFSG